MRKMMTCPKCKKYTFRTKHHILPRRWYGENNHIIYLCRKDHDNLESLIPFKKMSKRFYKQILIEFMRGDHDESISNNLEKKRLERHRTHQSRQVFTTC